MKSVIIIVVFALLFYPSDAQTFDDLKGRWEGVHYYGDTTRLLDGTLIVRASTIDSMRMILTIDELVNGKFKGKLREHFFSDPSGTYFDATVVGFVREDKIHFDTFDISENRMPAGNRWCRPKATGFLVKNDTSFSLHVTFESSLTCTVGPAMLEKKASESGVKKLAPPVTPLPPRTQTAVIKKPDSILIVESFKARSRTVMNTISVTSDSIKVHFFDNGVIDGDSISIFINGKLEVAHVRLTSRKYTLNLKFEGSDEIDVAMFAENLGTIPPNTAMMQIVDGMKVNQARLSSDTKSSAVIKIRRTKK